MRCTPGGLVEALIVMDYVRAAAQAGEDIDFPQHVADCPCIPLLNKLDRKARLAVFRPYARPYFAVGALPQQFRPLVFAACTCLKS